MTDGPGTQIVAVILFVSVSMTKAAPLLPKEAGRFKRFLTWRNVILYDARITLVHV